MRKRIVSKNEKDTLKLGRDIGRKLQAGSIIALIGELGSGKTVLVKGIARGLGIEDAEVLVNSPSFVLLKEYAGRINLYHFDLYRLDNPRQAEELGWEEYLDKAGVLVIEWAERLGALLPEDCLRIELRVLAGNEREIKLIAQGERYKELADIHD